MLKLNKLNMVNLKTGNTIALEDLMTTVISEFVKQNKGILQEEMVLQSEHTYWRIPILKNNFAKRRAIVEKVLNNFETLV